MNSLWHNFGFCILLTSKVFSRVSMPRLYLDTGAKYRVQKVVDHHLYSGKDVSFPDSHISPRSPANMVVRCSESGNLVMSNIQDGMQHKAA